MCPQARLLTHNASRDDLSDKDYEAIYREARGYDANSDGRSPYTLTLDAFIAKSGSSYSKGTWSKWQRGQLNLSVAMKNDLRRAVNLPELSPSVCDVMTSYVHPDAVVEKVGNAPIGHRVVIYASTNGATPGSPARSQQPALLQTQPPAPPVTGARSSIVIAKPLWEQLNAIRQSKRITWEEFLISLLT